MITKHIIAAAQFSQPVYVSSGQHLAIQIVQHETDPATSLVGHFNIEIIPDIDGVNLPGDADPRWVSVDDFDMASNPIHKKGAVNRAWYRVGIPTGKHTSGEADITMWFTD